MDSENKKEGENDPENTKPKQAEDGGLKAPPADVAPPEIVKNDGEKADSKKVAVEATTKGDAIKIEGEVKPDATKKDAADDLEGEEAEIVPVIVQEESIRSEDEESVITDVYDEEDFKSTALLSSHSTIPIDTFEPMYPFYIIF